MRDDGEIDKHNYSLLNIVIDAHVYHIEINSAILDDSILCTSIAEALLKKKYQENNIDGIVDSAGFSPNTINDAPDPRAIEAAGKVGLKLSGSSRIFMKKDFNNFEFKDNFFEEQEMYDALINFYKYGFVIFKKVPTKNNFIVDFANSIAASSQ